MSDNIPVGSRLIKHPLLWTDTKAKDTESVSGSGEEMSDSHEGVHLERKNASPEVKKILLPHLKFWAVDRNNDGGVARATESSKMNGVEVQYFLNYMLSFETLSGWPGDMSYSPDTLVYIPGKNLLSASKLEKSLCIPLPNKPIELLSILSVFEDTGILPERALKEQPRVYANSESASDQRERNSMETQIKRFTEEFLKTKDLEEFTRLRDSLMNGGLLTALPGSMLATSGFYRDLNAHALSIIRNECVEVGANRLSALRGELDAFGFYPPTAQERPARDVALSIMMKVAASKDEKKLYLDLCRDRAAIVDRLVEKSVTDCMNKLDNLIIIQKLLTNDIESQEILSEEESSVLFLKLQDKAMDIVNRGIELTTNAAEVNTIKDLISESPLLTNKQKAELNRAAIRQKKLI